MQKPLNYDETRAYVSYEPLPAGNYECEILKVDETESKKTKKPMLNIYLDIRSGEYKGFFSAEYEKDTRPEKKWPCIVYQLVEDKDGYCHRGLKTFIEAVAASNRGFDPAGIWGDDFCRAFKNLSVGAGFRREQYENQSGQLRWSTKCDVFFPIDEVESRSVLEDKPLETARPSYAGDYDAGGRLPWDE